MKKFLVIKKWFVHAESTDAALSVVADQIDTGETVVIETVMKPTIEEVIAHYKTGVQGEDPICLVCNKVISGPATESYGQIRCSTCGTSYQWQGCQLREEFLREHNLNRDEIARHYCDIYEYVPLLRLYWQEVGKRMPFGIYTINSPITQDETDSFYGWLTKNAERFQTEYPSFNWQGLKREYA